MGMQVIVPISHICLSFCFCSLSDLASWYSLESGKMLLQIWDMKANAPNLGVHSFETGFHVTEAALEYRCAPAARKPTLLLKWFEDNTAW